MPIEAGEGAQIFEAFRREHADDLMLLGQNRLMPERDFLRFAKDRGIRAYGIGTGDPGRFRALGWLPADAEDDEGVPLFHPFRIYPVHWILESCDLHVMPSSSLNRERFLDFLADVVDRLPALEAIGETADEANQIVLLPILLDPVYWPEVSGIRKRAGLMDAADYETRLTAYTEAVRQLIAALDVDLWKGYHERLRLHASSLDGNSDVYLLLRLSPWQRREKLKGSISAALWLRHMAEVLRRAFEAVHDVQWIEEDTAFTQWTRGARTRLFGSERPLERPGATRPYLAFHFGLHTGSIVRWYVEGETEYGAVRELLPGAPTGGIELVNLKGSLARKPSVALKLSDSLEQDRNLRRFSIISFDLDQPDTVRLIQQQIAAGKVVGYVSANEPDFEFANFTVAELVEVAAGLDESEGLSREPLRSGDWVGVDSGAAFAARYAALSERKGGLKGEDGEQLSRDSRLRTLPMSPGIGDRSSRH